jgi:polyhydroxybutyrate depolymerase
MDITQRAKLMLYAIYAFIALVLVGLPTAAFVLYKQHTYPQEALQLASYAYPDTEKSCAPGSKTGASGVTNNLRTEKGFRYHLRTPDNYDAHYAHPLLMVFAPSVSGTLMEKYTGLTKQATQAGMIVAYVDGKRLNLAAIQEFGRIPSQITEKWCVDEQRVFVTGHSDGGTISSALAFLEDSSFRPTAIAPSAAGITGEELKQYACPQPLSVMVMHNEGDTHFPGFGKQAANWWASCNQCGEPSTTSSAPGCIQYPDCANDVETYYCEGQGGSHLSWPHLNEAMLKMFLRSPNKQVTINKEEGGAK